ncbi:glycosyltransferase family 4 protein [Nocardioides sediminis]|uniref:glycosyltransferase family 4 protein n=1 Tax=Nocardioides sediminis TaxID=433648 RepID=UPI001F1B94FD|nr:glycosyltransferase family 4 protein [Nocardioides sediminis]
MTRAREVHRAHGRPRVLVIVQNLHVPFDRRVWLECGTLTRAGYDVTVICPRGPESARREVIDGVTVRTYRSRAPGKGGIGFVAEFTHSFLATTIRALDERRRGGAFAVVQACNPPDIFWPLARLLRLLDGSAFVFDHHDLCPELYESRFPTGSRLPLRALLWLERMTFRTADRVVSTNDSYAEIARRRGGKRPEHVTVVRTGPDPERLSPGPADPARRRGHAHLAAYLGVMGPQDGVDLALAAADVVVNRWGRTDIAFTLMGSGDCFEELVAQRDRLGLRDHVELTGRVPDETVAAVLRTADVGLCPDPENPLNDVSTMNKTMEYMAFALPVVAFDLKETRVSAQDAAVYAQDGAESFAEELVALVDDPEKRGRLGARGRARILDKLAWRHQEAAYLRVFAGLVGRPVLVPVEG